MFYFTNTDFWYVFHTRKPFHGQAGDHVEPRTQEPLVGELLAEHTVRDHVVG